MNSAVSGLSLRANFTWTFFGNAIYSGCQWAILVIMARLGTPEMVGEFTFGLAVCAPITVFSNLQLRLIQATDVADEYCFADYLWLRVITTFLSFVTILAVAFWGGYSSNIRFLIVFVGVAKCIESFSDILFGLSQKYERLDLIAISMMIKGALALIMMTATLSVTGNVLWGTVALCAAWFLPLILFDVPKTVRILRILPMRSVNLWLPTSPKQILRLARLAVPMGWVVFVMSLSSNLPRYFLQSTLGERSLGLFSATAALPGVLVLVINPLTHSFLPRLARFHAGRDNTFWNLIAKSSVLVLVGGSLFVGVAALIGNQLLGFLYGKDYGSLGWLLIFFAVAALAQNLSTVFGGGLSAMRRFSLQGIISTVHCGLTLVLCIAFIPKYGLLGSGIAAVASAFALTILTGLALILGCGPEKAKIESRFPAIF